MISGARTSLKFPSSKEGSCGPSSSWRSTVSVSISPPPSERRSLASFFAQARGTLFSLIDMFTGGGLERLQSLPWHYALYQCFDHPSASHRGHSLSRSAPKRREMGRKKIVQYTRYGTVVLSMIQGFGIAVGLENMQGAAGEMVVMVPGWSFSILTVITLTAGTAFIMWLGEQITERGIGNGISLIHLCRHRCPNAQRRGQHVRIFQIGADGHHHHPFS